MQIISNESTAIITKISINAIKSFKSIKIKFLTLNLT
jgi:hypothetical protein